ncbi:kinesin-like protein Klp5 [Puccinia graminis f. sp. tritici]|uniref:Kinesin-like protein Klp5 n=1 Tax=Puccinia graminis f. sp. tritici TaxID=56615 RepID=A0A5B0QG27_PUCGR|nr:kinesin-like protein Klp5 [Puccinia graminis f. sp. tritici]
MASSISVAVRVRPLTEKEKNQLIPTQSSSSGIFSDGCLTSASNNQSSSISAHKSLRSIVKVLDDRVLIFDPAESNPIQQAQRQILARFSSKPSPSPSNTLNHHSKKVKDMRFCFDRVFNENASQEDVYHGAAKDLIDGVLGGFNATVFAYGATGCGKTHTITGTPEAPGIVYLLMKDLFGRIADQEEDTTTEISISYLEIYNETIRDLLNPNAPILNLREANSSVSVPGLSTLTPTSASDVITVISSGNSHRTVHGTEANAVSSRSHAVMSVNIRRKPKTAGLIDDWTVATLSVIDLAGSERASVTKNKGERLLEGANINKSLLALGNCINALCDPKSRGNHVPYRNSKLTRLLKHSLGGNCRTLMIVCVAPTSAHYDETHNTLQYANRAKEIKTKVTRNIISVDRHVSQYVQVIFQLRQELEERKKNEAVKEDRLRKEISRQRVELDSALSNAKKHWKDYMLKAQPASHATGRLEGLEFVRSTLCVWNEQMNSDPDTSDEIKQWLVDALRPLLIQISNESQAVRQIIEQGSVAKSMYEACVGSLGRTVERSLGPDGKTSFDNELSGWTNDVGKLILDSFHGEGRAKTLADLVGEIASWLIGITAQFFLKHTSEESQRRFTEATKAAFQSFCSSNQNSTGFSVPSVPFNLSKIDYSSPSTAETSNTTAKSTKARRASSTNSPTKSASAYFAKRTSPRKHSIFGGRAQPSNPGILKRSTGIPVKSDLSESQAQPTGMRSVSQNGTVAGGKTGGVRWRDVESDGEERLESFDRTGSSNGAAGGGTDESMFSADQSSILLDLPSHSTEKILSTAILEGKPSVSSPEKPTVEARANESSSSAGGGRSNRMKAGYLSRNNKAGKSGRTMMVSTLDSLGEEEEEEEGEEGDLTVKAAGENKPMTAQRVTLPSSFSFSGFTLPPSNLSNYPMAEDAPPTRRTTLSSTNTNSNTGNTDSQAGSTKSVARAGRRDSAVGPIRHSKPTAALRRRSLNIYHREPSVSGERSRAPAGLGSTGSSTGSISSTITTTNTKNEFPRRASRVPLINSSLILSSSLSGSGTSSGPGRSPRKAAARSLLGSAASSALPPASNTRTRLAARRSMATLQSAKPSLSSSHLLHHDHTGLSSSSSTTTNNNPSGNGSNSIRPRRISLLPTPINNPNFSFSSSSSSANNSQIHHPPDGAGANGSICLPNKKDLFGGPSLSSSSTTGAAGNGSASSNHSSHHVWR